MNPGDTFTVADVKAAVAVLDAHNVKPIDGFYTFPIARGMLGKMLRACMVINTRKVWAAREARLRRGGQR